MTHTSDFSILVPASKAQVIAAFKTPYLLDRWLANNTQADHYQNLIFQSNAQDLTTVQWQESDEQLHLTWRDSAGQSDVMMTVIESEPDQMTLVQLAVSGNTQQKWALNLHHLLYLFETGLDGRLYNRPMVGVYLNELDRSTQEELNAPILKGVMITGLVTGGAAEQAGLQIDDVFIDIAGAPITEFHDFGEAIGQHRVGDTIAINVYRNAAPHTLQLTLTARPKPELLADLSHVVEYAQTSNQAVFAKVKALFATASTESSARRPEAKNWSANEVLAHLIWAERHQHLQLWASSGGAGFLPWPNNSAVHLAGVLAAHSTHTDLLAELERALAETCAIIAVLPADFVETKVGRMLLIEAIQRASQHIESHFSQIESALTVVITA